MNCAKINLPLILVALLGLTSCGEPAPSKYPTITTPANAKVDLSQVSLSVSNAKITADGENKFNLSFDYTVTNTAGAHLSFTCLYPTTAELIQVELTAPTGELVPLGRRLLEGLTLTEPRPIKIPNGSSTKNYTTPLTPSVYETGDLITLRVRLHAPSRYDELRTSIEAPLITITWP